MNFLLPRDRTQLHAQIDAFFAKGGKVEKLPTTQLKPHRFLIDGTEPKPVKKLRPCFVERNKKAHAAT